MAESNTDSPTIDPKSGFCSKTKIYHSLRPLVQLPPESAPLSAADYVFSLLRGSSSLESTALIDSSTGFRLSFSDLIRYTETLAASLQHKIGLSRGNTAFVLCPSALEVPILYFSLLSLGVVICPANPIGTEPEIHHQVELCRADIAFATSDTAHKLPSLHYQMVLLDSPEFGSMMTIPSGKLDRVDLCQSDAAAILFSSGTTGLVKGVVLTHRNWISLVAGIYSATPIRDCPAVILCTTHLFHVYGFVYCVKAVGLGETLVLMKKFELRAMLRAIEECRVTQITLVPPVVLTLAKEETVTDDYDLSSLETAMSGGAPIRKEVIERFKKRFPKVQLAQSYGLTETTGGISRTLRPEESLRLGSSGRLAANCQVKIIDPDTGVALPPCKQGELWVRGPTIMKGYVGDEEATAAVLDSEGWLRTGDLCYIDDEGFVFVVDRLKELIKYKGYQVPPAELEQLLESHSDIADAAVIPYPDEEAGQVPMAFVVRRPQSTLNEAQVKDFIAKQVAPYKKIRRVSFINYIPRNAAGKILRKELKNLIQPAPTSKL